MALPLLQNEHLSILELLEQNEVNDGEFYASTITQNNGSLPLSSTWLNAPSLDGFSLNISADQGDIFSDTESLTSCGSAVASPAVFGSVDNTEQRHFIYPLQDNELKQLSVKELNLKLKGQPKEVVKIAKRRRRTLKNRGYAHSCRIKRLQEKSTLQRTKAELETIIAELQQQLAMTENEKDVYKTRYESLVRRIMSMQNIRKA